MRLLKIVSRIIFALCLIIKASLAAETMGVTLLEHPEKNKKVAIINDRHTDVHFPQKIDDKAQVYLQQQSDQVQKFFDRLKEKNVKTTAIIEFPKRVWETQQWAGIGFVLGNTLKNVYENGWRQGSIHFKTCDNRSDDDIFISSLCTDCNLYKKYVEHYKKENKEVPSCYTGPSVKMFLVSIAERNSYLSKWVINLHKHGRLPNHLKNKLLKKLACDFVKAEKAMKEELSNSDNIDEKSTILDLLCIAKNPLKITSLTLDESGHACDIPLLAIVLGVENKTSVVHVGHQHGALLHERLRECGFISKDSEVCMKVEQDGPCLYKTPQRVPRNISDIIMTFFTNSDSLSGLQVEWDEVIDITEEAFK